MSDRLGTPTMPLLTKLASPSRLTKLRMPTVAPKGPRLYRLDAKPQTFGGPGEPPEGFVTPHTSRDEWFYYWALSVVQNDPPNPRQPPFVGGLNWGYQHPDIGGLGGRESIGGAVTDFIIREYKGKSMIHRLQTEFFHIMAAAEVIARDLYQKTHLSGYTDIIDVYSQWFIHDETGAAACATARRALGGEHAANPNTFGLAERVRG